MSKDLQQENKLKENNILESNRQLYMKIKNNILELFLENHNFYKEKEIKRKNKSEPNSKYRRKNLQKKIKFKYNKQISQKIELTQKKEKKLNDSFEYNLKITEDEKPFNLNDFNLKINQELKEKDNINKNKSDNKNNNIINNKKRSSKDSKDLIEKINGSSGLLNINSNNDIMNANIIKYSSNDVLSNNSNNQNINALNYYSNSNTNKSNTNYALNFFGISNNQEDNSSLNSSKNELSSKKNKLNNNLNKINNLSSSSYSKNFVLKSEICKSTFHNENRHHKNNNSEDNPILSYFGKDISNKKYGNFYLFTEGKSIEEIDQNQYINFFPSDDNPKKTSKDIMSCNYMDSNIEISEKINAEIINENYENNNEYDFNLNDLHEETNEKKHNFEYIKNNLMKGKTTNNVNNNTINNNNNNNKSNIDTNFEYDDINNINKIIDLEKDSLEKKENNNNNNINESINTSNDNNNKNSGKLELALNNNKNNNNNISDFNINDSDNNNNDNMVNNNNDNLINNSQIPLSFVNNLFNINNNNFNQFKINPMMNPGLPNYFYNQGLNPNPIMNYYNANFPPMNYYQQMYSQNNIQYQSDFYNPINNKINKNNNNNTNSKNNNNNNKINNISNSINNNNNIKTNNIYDNNMNSLLQKKNFYEYTDEEILNLCIMIIKDQHGCRFMQEKIKSNNHFANELLFPRIKYNLKELCCDNFGNYFLQVMVDLLSFDNINKFFDMTQNDFTEICISPHGTRVIQKIIEKIAATPILMNRFIYNVNSKDLGIIFKSPYGNHMIQKFLATTHSSEYSNFIFNYIYNNFLDIANSKHGVCVIQKCVSEGDERQRGKIYEFIIKYFNDLIKDQYGNYLIQYLLINTKTEEKFKEIFPIILKIEENMIDLCKSQFSANVIEKCFENSEIIVRDHLLDSLTKNDAEKIIDISLDQFGIYVIQKALKLKNSIYKKKLIEIINSKEKIIKNINFSEYKYKNILKTINSHKELMEVFSKMININNINNNNDKNQKKENNNNNNYNEKGNDNRNEYYNYNRGKNKRGRKNHKNNNRF